MNHKKLASKLSSVCLPTQTSTESFCNFITIHRCKRFIEYIWWLGPWVCFPMFTLALHFIASSGHSPLKMIRNEFAYQIIQWKFHCRNMPPANFELQSNKSSLYRFHLKDETDTLFLSFVSFILSTTAQFSHCSFCITRSFVICISFSSLKCNIILSLLLSLC